MWGVWCSRGDLVTFPQERVHRLLRATEKVNRCVCSSAALQKQTQHHYYHCYVFGTNLHWMRGSSVLGVTPLDLFVKFAHILRKHTVSWELWEHSGSACSSDLYLNEHEAVEAAVHHQPQRAGRGLSARTFAGTLDLSALLVTLPLQAALLLPLLSSLPAMKERMMFSTSAWTEHWFHCGKHKPPHTRTEWSGSS